MTYYLPQLLEAVPDEMSYSLKDYELGYYTKFFLGEIFPLEDIDEYSDVYQALEITAFILLLRHSVKRDNPDIGQLPTNLLEVKPLFQSDLTLENCLNTDVIALCVPLHNEQEDVPKLGIRFGVKNHGCFWPKQLGEKKIKGRSYTLADALIRRMWEDARVFSTADRYSFLTQYCITGYVDKDEILNAVEIGNKFKLGNQGNNFVWICPSENEEYLQSKQNNRVFAVKSVSAAYEKLLGPDPSNELLDAIVNNDIQRVSDFVKKVHVDEKHSVQVFQAISKTPMKIKEEIKHILFLHGFEDYLLEEKLRNRHPTLPEKFLKIFLEKR